MNKYIYILISALILSLTSCYDDYVKDFDYDAIYFANQTDVRSFVYDEINKIEVGPYLSGVKKNNRNRDVDFIIDESLLTEDLLANIKADPRRYISSAITTDELLLLDKEYFALSNDRQFVIKKGDHVGAIDVTINNNFYNDPKSLSGTYILPLRIQKADADSILTSKNYLVLFLKYESKLFGNYYHGGRYQKIDALGNPLTVEIYPTKIPCNDNEMWELTTISPTKSLVNKCANLSGKNMIIELKEDGKVALYAPEGSDYSIEYNAEKSYFNQPKLLQDRKVFLDYEVKLKDNTSIHANDTLTFRNRVRDGVNEWQDENPEHYK